MAAKAAPVRSDVALHFSVCPAVQAVCYSRRSVLGRHYA